MIGSFHQGGSERQALALTRLLKDPGECDVYLATLSREGVLLRDAEAMGFHEIPEFPLNSFFDLNFPTQVRKCSRFLREMKIDIVHTHDFYTNVFGMAAASMACVKTPIASKRETGGMRTAAQDTVEKLAFGRSKAIVANSRAVKEYLANRGIGAEKIRVIYNGLDLSRFEMPSDRRTQYLEKLGIRCDEKTKIITLVANLRHEVKNVPMLLRSARSVVAQFPGARFLVAGEGELKEDLERTAEELALKDNVHFIGRCAEIPTLLASSDICVLTSTAEGFSNSILEYMAAAKPVIATDVGGAREAIADGESGYLIASNDDRELTARLCDLLNAPERSGEMGKRGRDIVAERFSEQAQLAKTLELYRSLAV